MTFTGRRYPDAQYMAIHVENGRVTGDEPIQTLPEPPGVQRWIMPGFFDLQVNGFMGRAFIDAEVSVGDVTHMARAILATGTTHFLPTVVTAAIDTMEQQLNVIASAMHEDPLVKAMCPGVHVEGPFLSPEDGPRGAHPREHIHPPDLALFERLQRAAGGRIVLMTLAPEVKGAIDFIRVLAARGITVALGHHRADAESLHRAIDAGARMSTHLGNACDAMLPRHENVIWRQLGDDRLWASFIADGHHLPGEMLRCMLRAKSVTRSVLITDAMSGAGMPPGRTRFGSVDVEKLESGRVVLPGTPYLAGSAADMPTVIANAVRLGGVSLMEAVAMGSVRPAMLLSGWRKRWSAFGGDVADMVELDWHEGEQRIAIRQVVCGEHAWIRQENETADERG